MSELDELVKETLVFTAQKGWARSHEAFFTALVTFLGDRLGVDCALIDELLPDGKRARTVGLYVSGQVVPELEYDLRGTPCENVMGKTLCCYADHIQQRFPEDAILRDMSAESYLGIPLWDSQGTALGLIAVIDRHPIADRERAETVLQMVAVRCAHELERKRDEERRRRMESEILRYQKLESVGRLASGIAHDMNNVLTAIIGMTSLLRDRSPEGTSEAGDLDLVLSAAQRGRKLVKGLTDFSRDRLSEAAPVKLNDLVRQEAEILGRTTFRRVDLDVALEDPLPTVMGEPETLSNALMNLCVNALDAMPEGGRLSFRTRTGPGGVVEVSVQDTGQGMTPEILARAMDPFFTTKPPGKGSGLGLSVVYGAMKAHGGQILIESEPGRGTCITLRFPAARAPEAGPCAEEAGPERTHPAGLRVLVVDDEEVVRETTEAVLHHLGYQVTLASSGSEGLDLLGNGLSVDLAIVDQNMPGMTGIEFLHRLRATHAGLPVILCSGLVDKVIRAVLEADAKVMSLEKPFNIEELAEAVRKADARGR